jgi:hypothetical protein
MNAIRSYIKGTGNQWWRFQEKTIEKVRQGLHYTFRVQRRGDEVELSKMPTRVVYRRLSESSLRIIGG